ncbi:MAG: mannose-6-phosphate isomerase, class I [Candidatus Margulisiibacteriota bacterium]
MQTTANPKCYRIKPFINTSAWGGRSFIPDLFRIDNHARTPHAEAWFGAHKDGASTVLMPDGNSIFLGDLIKTDPARFLGNKPIKRFGETLPYLMKVLDAEEILSMQAHPDKEQAIEGFAKEDLSKPVNERTYKDNNHKPEMQVALTEFFLLHSFRPAEEIHGVLARTKEFNPLACLFENQGLEGLYKEIMTMPQNNVDVFLAPAIQRLTPKYRTEQLSMDDHDYWACKAAETHPLHGGHFDRGLFSVYLMNLLHLMPGQGTFQPARTLHSYLFGTTMELMAPSDNTLRAGLTQKKVDVPELLRVLDFTPRMPEILHGIKTVNPFGAETVVYQTPMEEAVLSRTKITGSQHTFDDRHSFDMALVTDGEGSFFCSDFGLRHYQRGDCFGVVAGEPYTLHSLNGTAEIFRASTPIHDYSISAAAHRP